MKMTMNMSKSLALAALLTLGGAQVSNAQTTGGLAGDPNAETNQVPAPSNSQPADPGAGSYSDAREPTAPDKRGDDDTPGRIPVEPNYSLQ